MTLKQIQEVIAPLKKCSRGTIYAYLRELHLKPVGSIRQRPQQWPDDSAGQILKQMGFVQDNRGRWQFPTLAELRAVKRKALEARGRRAAA